MKKRSVLKLGVTSSVLVIALAGCSLSATTKDEYAQAYDELNKVDTLETSNVLSFNVEGEIGLSDFDEILANIDSTKISFNTVSDSVKQQTEVDLKVTLNEDVASKTLNPKLVIDEKTSAIYIPESDFEDFSLGIPDTSDPDNGTDTILVETKDIMYAGLLQSFISQFEELGVNELLTEDNFTKQDNVITIKIPSDVLQKALDKSLKDKKSMFADEYNLSSDEADTYINGLQEFIYLEDGVIKATIDSRKIQKQTIEIPFIYDNGQEKVSFVLNLNTEVKGFNKKVDFSYDLDKVDTESYEEFFNKFYLTND